MRRRILLQVLIGAGLLTVLMILTTRAAYADNCGSLTDCFYTTDTATAVTVGVAVLIAVAALALPSLLDAAKSGHLDIPPESGGIPEPGRIPNVPPPAAAGQGPENASAGFYPDRGMPPEHGSYPQVQTQPHHVEQGGTLEQPRHLHPHHPEEHRPVEHHPEEHHPEQHRPVEHRQEGHRQSSDHDRHTDDENEGQEGPEQTQQLKGPQVLHSEAAQESQAVRPQQEIQSARPEPEVQAVRFESEPRFQVPLEPIIEPQIAGPILGLHHVTAITGNPQQNIDFYTGVLGLRLVKVTVNFDNPATYHLSYGDDIGRPGTILSFFAWPGAPRGSRGTGQATAIAFSVPEGTLHQWGEYLTRYGLNVTKPSGRFDEQILSFFDPDGIQIELVAHRDTGRSNGWGGGPIPLASAIRGLYGVTLSEAGYERTHALLTQVLGFRPMQAIGNRFRYEIGPGGPGALLDVLSLPNVPPSQPAVGTVEHIGWRTPGDEQQQMIQQRIASFGFAPPQVIDRYYYRVFPMREPGGTLFEFATDQPGFIRDEPPERLGSRLILPPWLETRRFELEQVLPPLRLPTAPI